MGLRRAAALLVLFSFALVPAACGGGGGGGGGGAGGGIPGGPTPTPGPTVTPSATSVLCTSAGATQSIGRQAADAGVPRRAFSRAAEPRYVPGVIAVTYDREHYRTMAHADRENAIDLPALGRIVSVARVMPGDEAAAMTRLASEPGVRNVNRVSYRSALSTTATLTNDPYYRGFAGGNTPPLYESASVPGQWDVHVICAANAWAYGNANSTGVLHPGALGGTVPLAIIDTGADLTHPELSGRVSYAESDINGITTVGLAFMHDNEGHGTDVAGIAGAAANNGIGFAGVAYASPLRIYRVFPDPPSGGCPSGTTNTQCEAQSSDIALAIAHAVANGAKVINMSLGASSADPTEETAVANAVAAGVVVVAAAGNEGRASLDYPAADPGVIAVGASGLDDSNPLAIIENVATYSDYGASNPTQWGVVAPGGTAGSGTDSDDLHWIENIYTSTASDSANFCKPDFGSVGGPNDCRVLIDGTSQASPHVAGAVALLLSVGASAANIKSILCTTAVPIAGGKGGCGRLNVYKAMAQVVGDPSP